MAAKKKKLNGKAKHEAVPFRDVVQRLLNAPPAPEVKRAAPKRRIGK